MIFTCTEEGTGSISTENKSCFLISYGVIIVIKYVLGLFVLPCVMASFLPFFKIFGTSTEILVPSLHICVYICICVSSLFHSSHFFILNEKSVVNVHFSITFIPSRVLPHP